MCIAALHLLQGVLKSRLGFWGMCIAALHLEDDLLEKAHESKTDDRLCSCFFRCYFNDVYHSDRRIPSVFVGSYRCGDGFRRGISCYYV
jgi:hypothetical protein